MSNGSYLRKPGDGMLAGESRNGQDVLLRIRLRAARLKEQRRLRAARKAQKAKS